MILTGYETNAGKLRIDYIKMTDGIVQVIGARQ